jgi:hypothetical protein
MKSIWRIAAVAVMLLYSCAGLAAIPKPQRTGDFVIVFGGNRLTPKHRDPNIDYNLDPAKERYFVHIPESYTGTTPYGLIVFIDAGDQVGGLPDGWASVLDGRKFLFVEAESSGNDQYRSRRLGLAVLGALEMMSRYRIDPRRVYVSGYSGGARMAGFLGFFQPDIFRGTIQNCGADFYKPVPKVAATSSLDTAGKPYGIFNATAEEIVGARRVRFVLITGTNDFRRGNILDVFNGGFFREGFRAKLLDVPGMGHTTCSGETLAAALDFIERSP